MSDQAADACPPEVGEAYHRWYYDTRVWERTTWLGVKANKAISDLWVYQELICDRAPAAVIEFGTGIGGSTLFFATVLDAMNSAAPVVTVDIDHGQAHPSLRHHPRIRMLSCSSTAPELVGELWALRRTTPGTWFVVLDSDHSQAHVRAELDLLHSCLLPGDYVIVEDTNINGNPVLPEFGPGPLEALQDFLQEHGSHYRQDVSAEAKFGFTFAPNGFLIRS